MTELATSNLTIRRGGRTILDTIGMQCRAGEFVAVIGANGAGKSTLLAALAGLIQPDGGSVRLDSRPLSAMPREALARRRAYLPQNPRCEWPISVERLIALGLTPVLPAFGGLPESWLARVNAVIGTCDLERHREQAATTLSGGEFARAMLARALVGDPDILIVDEPMAGLDPRHVLDTVQRLLDLARAGKLVIAAVHDLTLAARYATRIVALNHGRVAADGTPADVLDVGLIRSVFNVDARIATVNGATFVDYLSPS